MSSSPDRAVSNSPELHGGLWIPLLRPYLESSVVTEESVARLERQARRVPLGPSGAIELRLGARSNAVDLGLRVGGPIQARQLAPLVEPAHVRCLLERWTPRRDPRVPCLWIEFDLDEEPGRSLCPVFIARLERVHDPRWLNDSLLPELLGRQPTSAEAETVQRSLEAVSGMGYVFYAYDLQSRGGRALRLDFRIRPGSLMGKFLERLGRLDLAARIDEAGSLLAGAESYHLNFDIGEEGPIGPRLGVEAAFTRRPAKEPGWAKMLDELVAAGLCTSVKRDALLRWPGYDTPVAADWPRAVGKDGYLIRNLSHVKLVCRVGRPLTAKGYLLYGHYRRNDAGRLELREN